MFALRGVARIFQRGGVTVSNIIVMAFSPRNIIGCFLKKGLQSGGGGVTSTPGPPRYAHGSGIDMAKFFEINNQCNNQ